MKSEKILDAIGKIDETLIAEAEPGHAAKKTWRRPALFIAAALLTFALCGFTAYELGWMDLWLQKPSVDPVETVQSAIENQMEKGYTISVRVDEIQVDEEETTRVAAMYSRSELAEARGWTDEYLADHFIVVRAKYYVEYDHTKTFMDDGDMEQYFYLTEEIETGQWTIVDNTSPNSAAASQARNSPHGTTVSYGD